MIPLGILSSQQTSQLIFSSLLLLESENASRHLVTANGDFVLGEADGVQAGISDVTGDFLTFDNDDDFNVGTGDFTWQEWIRTIPKTYARNLMEKYSSALPEVGYQIEISGNTGYMFFEASDSSARSYCFGSTNVADENWHHIACVRDSSGLRIYVDGVEEVYSVELNRTTVRNTDSSEEFVVGYGVNGWAGDYYGGARARSHFTKRALYTTGFTPPSYDEQVNIDTDTVLALNFEGTPGSTRIIDSAKPSYVIDANDDFSFFNSRKWYHLYTPNGNETTEIVSEKLRMTIPSSVLSNDYDWTLFGIQEDGEFIASIDLDMVQHVTPTTGNRYVYFGLFFEGANAYISFTSHSSDPNWNYKIKYNIPGSGWATSVLTWSQGNTYNIKIQRIGTTVSLWVGETQIASFTSSAQLQKLILSAGHSGSSFPNDLIVDWDNLIVIDGVGGNPIQTETDFGATVKLCPDTSGNELDGIPVNIIYNPLKLDYVFNATSSLINLSYGDSPILGTNDFSVIIEGKIEDNVSDYCLVEKYNNSTQDGFYIKINASTGRVTFETSNTGSISYVIGTTDVFTLDSYQIVCTRDTVNGLRIFINGSEETYSSQLTKTSIRDITNSEDLNIGYGGGSYAGSYLDGLITKVEIIDAAALPSTIYPTGHPQEGELIMKELVYEYEPFINSVPQNVIRYDSLSWDITP